MAQRYPIIEESAGGVVVLARTTVDAQQAAAEALGEDCTITAVEKVQRGGIGGFFATELIQVTAAPSRRNGVDRSDHVSLTTAEDLVSALRQRSPQFADRLLDELGRSSAAAVPSTIDDERAAFVDRFAMAMPSRTTSPAAAYAAASAPLSPCGAHAALHASGSPTVVPPAVVRADVAPSTSAPVVVPPAAAPSTAGGATTSSSSSDQRDGRWSPRALRALGLPDRIVDIATAAQPSTEADWIVALMGALKGICTPRTTGPVVMVGPNCANLARQLRLVSISADEVGESVSSVAVANVGADVVRSGLNQRQVHLVVGGSWHHLTGVQPAIVSAASTADLLEAIRVCVAWDATLGWGWLDDHYERLEVFTVVAHVRHVLHAADHAARDASVVA